MNWKPINILFVGDEPSSKNVSRFVPFVGTSSYKRLLKWIGELDLDISQVEIVNAGQQNKSFPNIVLYLGKRAYDKDFKTFGEYFEARTKIIDHPSPRNRKFNDPIYEKKMLRQLKEWIYE